MNLSKESMKHFNRLCESILRRYDIATRDQLRDTLQKELSVTLARVLDNSSVSEENDMFPAEGVSVITAPLNSLEDIARNSVNGQVQVYIKVPYYLDEPDVVTGDGGEEFLNVRSIPKSTKLYLGVLSYSGSNCSFIISEELDPSLIDLDMYATCWNTNDPRLICNFLNDIYNRISKKGCYVTTNLLSSKTNDSIRHVSYGKLLAYAKSLYPLSFGNETSIMRNILQDLLGCAVQDVVIAKPDDDVSFAVVCNDNDEELIQCINTELERFM